MNRNRIALLISIAALVVALLSVNSPARAGQPAQPLFQSGAPQVVSYQGQVSVGGAPYTGAGSFKFAVVNQAGNVTYWSNDGTATGGGEPTAAITTTVTNGLFNVLLGDTSLPNMTALPASAFDGTGRYLRVWFSADGSAFTLLSPDRRIAAVPYALQAEDAKYAASAGDAGTLDALDSSAFWQLGGNTGTTAGTHFLGTTDNQALEIRVNNSRVLRLEPNATSPNLLGGYSGNWLTPGVYGTIVAGGGTSLFLNRVTDNYGTVGGGKDNQAGDNASTIANTAYATVGGGYSNTASGAAATVSGGYSNTASGGYAAISGGDSNTASGGYAAISGGSSNTASNSAAMVGGGYGNTASGYAATVGGGYGNTASGEYAAISSGTFNIASGSTATIGGGNSNIASGGSATVSGGTFNTASGNYATVPGGFGAKADQSGQMAYANGGFGAPPYNGNAQGSLYVMRRGASMVAGAFYDLFLDGSSARLSIPLNRTVSFDILIVGRNDVGASAGYRIVGLVENVGGTTALIGTPTVTVLGEDNVAWDARVLADNTLDVLLVQVATDGGTFRWVATVHTAEATW